MTTHPLNTSHPISARCHHTLSIKHTLSTYTINPPSQLTPSYQPTLSPLPLNPPSQLTPSYQCTFSPRPHQCTLRFMHHWGEFLKRSDAIQDPQYQTIKDMYAAVQVKHTHPSNHPYPPPFLHLPHQSTFTNQSTNVLTLPVS